MEKKMKKRIFLGFILVFSLLGFAGCFGNGQGGSTETWKGDISIDDIEMLSVGEDGDFYILQFTDIQSATVTAVKAVQAIMIQARKQADARVAELSGGKGEIGLVALTGDNWGGPLGTSVQASLIKFLDGFDIPYAPVYGNHDHEAGDLSYMGEVWENGKNSLFKMGPKDIYGVGNYMLAVKDGDDKIITSLLFLDSNSSEVDDQETADTDDHKFGGAGYDFIRKNQIDWAVDSIGVLNAEAGRAANNKLPVLAFFHIPIPEYRAIGLYQEKFSPAKSGNPNDWLPMIAKDEGEVSSKTDAQLVLKSAQTVYDALTIDDVNYQGYIYINQGKKGSTGFGFPYTQEKMATRKGENVYNSKKDAGFFPTLREN